MMPAISETMVYPAVMDHKLRRIRRRQCALAVVRAVLLATAALIAAMLTVMSIDGLLTLFNATARISLTTAALALAVVTLALAAYRPLVAALGLSRAAGRADQEVPQLEERWTTVADFTDYGHRPQTSLGRAMLRQVTSEAVALGRLVEPARVAPASRLRRPLLLSAVCAAALVGFLGLNWRQNLVLLARFWAPLADISATRLESITGDVVAPRGEAVEVLVKMSGLWRPSGLLFIDADGATEMIELTPDAERPEHFVYRTTALEASFRYRVQSGDGRTPWHTVTAIDRPSLAEVRFALTAPDYVDRPKYEKPYLPDRVRALEGSRLNLDLRPAAALEKLDLLVTRGRTGRDPAEPASADPAVSLSLQEAAEERAERLMLSPDADGWYRFQATLTEDMTLSLLLLSPQGLTMIDRPECQIYVIADQAPVARVTRPNEELSVAADEVVEVEFEAHDDHGVARAELVVYGEPAVEGEKPPVLGVQNIPLNEQARSRHVTSAAQLDLGQFNLREGEKISFAVQVADNREAQPDMADSLATNLESVAQAANGESNQDNFTASPTEKAAPADPSESQPAVALDDAHGQSVESNRLQLKIAARLASAADDGTEQEESPMELRRRMVRIEKELQESETLLNQLVEDSAQTAIAEPQIQQLKRADERLADVERMVAELSKQSKDTPYAFAGLQMVEIDGSQVAPARDRVFAVINHADDDHEANLLEALHRVSRARELLAELLVRYDQAVREQELADSLEEVAKMYEVYVAGAQRLLRAQSKPAANPLERKMAVLDLDQEYLDRLQAVLEMRRDLMSELGRMLGDDPRLRGKYMDLVKRRQESLRDAFNSLYERQTALAAELVAWRQVDEAQREDVWAMAAELRLQAVASLAKDSSQLEEHARTQLPLGLDPTHGPAADALDEARQAAVGARSAAVKARRLLRDPFDESVDLRGDIDAVKFRLGELDAALERIAAENDDEDAAKFVAQRLADSRALVERVTGWSEIASHLRQRRYAGLAEVDQRLIAVQTEQLRISLQNADDELNGQFRGEVPADIREIARQLGGAMEAITFNQTAATFSLSAQELAAAENQHRLALAAFQRAEELFDRMRRMVVEVLDQNDPENPTAADLEDPTMDKLLQQLEREPDLNALLGIPDRPRNLRVMSDWMLWDQKSSGLGAMEESARRAKQRAEELSRSARKPAADDEEEKMDEAEPPEERLAKKIEELRRQAADPQIEPEKAEKLRQAAQRLEALRQKVAAGERDDDLTEDQWRLMAEEMLQEQVEELRRQAAAPDMDEEQNEKLRQTAERLDALRRQLADQDRGGGDDDPPQERIRGEQLRAMIETLVAAETLPDEQWNRVLSSLGSGLWQVRRRVPPDQYRRAIEQYQERIRRLRSLETSDARLP